MASKIRDFVERKVAAHKEDVAREVRRYGRVRPPEAQVGTRGWKSFSKIRYGTDAYRTGYDRIDWGS